MICPNCQNNIADNSRFCEYCGNSFSDYQYYDMNDDSATLTPKKKHLLVVPIVSIVIVLIAVAAGIIIYNTPANKLNRTLAMARKYYSQNDYKSAILAYKAAISIDPKCEDAYLELIDTYTAAREYENAVSWVDKSGKVLSTQKQQLKYKSIANTAIKKEKLDMLADFETDDNRVKAVLVVSVLYITDEKEEKALDYINANIDDADNLSQIHQYLSNIDDASDSTKITEVESATNSAIAETTSSADKNHSTEQQTETTSAAAIERKPRKLIKTITYPDDNFYTVWEYKYDRNGNIIKATPLQDHSVWSYEEYEYDQFGNMLVYYAKNYDGSIHHYTEYEYDSYFNIVKAINYRDGETTEQATEYEYDINGNITTEIQYHTVIYFGEEVVDKSTIKYFYSDGRISRKEYYYNDIYQNWREYQYNSDGMLIREANYFVDSDNISFIEYEYNENGDVVRTNSCYDAMSDEYSIAIYEYEYEYWD